MNIGIERVDNHKGITVKALLNSGTTELFMSKGCTKREKFKLEKLERLI